MIAAPRIRRLVLAAATLVVALMATAAPASARFHEYSHSFYGSGTSALQSPDGVAVDNSAGPSSGDVYVTDLATYRVEKFDPEGSFILMFGKEVDKTRVEERQAEEAASEPVTVTADEEDLCTAASGDACQAGTPSPAAGGFEEPAFIAVDGSSGPSAGDIYVGGGGWVSKFDPSGHLITSWRSGGRLPQGGHLLGIVVASNGEFITVSRESAERFAQNGTLIEAISIHNGMEQMLFDQYDLSYLNEGPFAIAIDGEGNYYNAAAGLLVKDGTFGETGEHRKFVSSEHHATGLTVDQRSNALYAIQAGATVQQFVVPCEPPPAPGLYGSSPPCEVAERFGAGRLAGASGIAVDSDTGNAYVVDTGHRRVAVFAGIPSTAPTVAAKPASAIHTDLATLNAKIGSTGEDTTYHFEYGPADCAGNPCTATAATGIGDPQSALASARIEGLTPGTTYHYRVLATNALGTTAGLDRTFTTYSTPTGADSCPNALARQQTGAAQLLDCRAYELVSAANAAGVSVASDLVPGQAPLPGYPQADGRALYTTVSGGIPGAGKPTNFGGDPYLATRGEHGWSTEYVGIPADVNQQTGPFASTLGEADPSLGAFAFAGAKLCNPCLNGETGLPVRTASGQLVQGMAGSLDPGPAANADILVRKRLSADGRHLIFGSTSQFEPDATPGIPTIYDRDLVTNTTKVVSKLPGGGNIPCLSDCAGTDGVAELGLSADGSRVLIGQLISTDAAGNRYFHLYMNVGDSGETIDLTPGAGDGVLFDGMTEDGSKVFFSSEEHLTGEDPEHSGASIYMWEEGHPLTLVSKGNNAGNPGDPGNTAACDPASNSARAHWNSLGPEANCGAVAIGGGGGVAANSGEIYFLSPELLDGASNGTQNAPNLYLAKPGSEPEYVATLESSLSGPTPLPAHHPFLRDFGSFTAANATAVDHQNGDLYVLDAGTNTIEKFDAEGNPVSFNFPAGSKEAAGNQLKGADTPAGGFSLNLFGVFKVNSIAVDPSNGDLYVPDLRFFGSAVDIFAPSGEYLRQIVVSQANGVAVDPTNGDVYVTTGFFGGALAIFDSSGNPLPSFPTIANPTSVAVDSSGTLYLGNGQEVASYQASTGNFLAQVDPHAATGLAVDPSDQHLYVDEGNRISEFDSEGNPLGTPSGKGNLSGSVGLAASSGSVYASDGTSVAVFAAQPVPDPSPAIDNPAVIDALSAAETTKSADFQVSPSGNDAVFTSTRSLTGYENAGFSEVFRYDAPSEALDCVSCDPAGAPGSGDAALASDGSSLTEDGRVFFTTPQQLVLRDVNGKKDAYEWEQGKVQPISTGLSSFDSGLLSVSADGTDAYFFTRETLVAGDENGSQMKLYDARSGGGFFVVPAAPSCAASDECHGAGTEAPAAPAIKTHSVTPGNVPPTKCKPGFARKHGKCVKHHPSHKHPHKRANHKRGGSK